MMSLIILLLGIYYTGEHTMPQIKNEANTKIEPVAITVIFDNNPLLKGLQTDWGFAGLVEVGKTKLLFDTGDNGSILLSNMSKLDIHPEDIDQVFLSHFHHDHTGGLMDFLEKNSDVTIYFPQSFPLQLVESMKQSGAKLVPVSSFQRLRENIFSLGELNGSIPEQSIAIQTSKGIVVITGCAHPGIFKVLEVAKSSFPEEIIYLAMGGFHLLHQSENELKNTANQILKMEILNIGPSHCSGDAARKMFSEIFKDGYIETGVGKKIVIE
jgi:7,8-dihydropterin-6-yl-methyl-4-(beta-D-ribofuranosyl)aminobenzene 5'-phosphate synthase